MSLHLAKARRLEALKTRNHDRVLVKPAARHSDVKEPDAGTVAYFLFEELRRGTTITQLANETGWSRSTILVNLYKVAKKTGVGLKRHDDELNMILPSGFEQENYGQTVLNMQTSVRSAAAEVVIPATTDCM